MTDAAVVPRKHTFIAAMLKVTKKSAKFESHPFKIFLSKINLTPDGGGELKKICRVFCHKVSVVLKTQEWIVLGFVLFFFYSHTAAS